MQVRIKSLALEQQDVNYNPFRCNRKQTYPKNQGIDLAESNKLNSDWDPGRTDCKHCGYIQENPSTLLTHYYAVVILVVEFSPRAQRIDFYSIMLFYHEVY